MNNINSEMLEKLKQEANEAYDMHCEAWEFLSKLSEPTLQELEHWISIREDFYVKQNKFEELLRKLISNR